MLNTGTAHNTKTLYAFLLVLAAATSFIGLSLGHNRANDDGSYLTVAQNILAGRGMSYETPYGTSYSYFPPGMSVVFAASIILFKSHYALVLAVLFSLMTVLTKMLYFPLCKRFLTEKGALLATLVWILYPPGWFWGTRTSPHTYAADMLVISLWTLMVMMEKDSLLFALLTGSLWATMLLMRGEYLFFGGVMAAAVFFSCQCSRKGAKWGAVILLGWSLTMAPWVYRNYQVHGKFLIGSSYSPFILYGALREEYSFTGDTIPWESTLINQLKQEKNEVAKMGVVNRAILRRIKENPSILFRTVGGNALVFWRPWLSLQTVSWKENAVYVISYVPIFLLFLFGLTQLPYKNPLWRIVLTLITYKFLIYLPTYVIIRFRETIIPFMILIAFASFRNLQRSQPISGKYE